MKTMVGGRRGPVVCLPPANVSVFRQVIIAKEII